MARRVSLPLTGRFADSLAAPSIDAMRARLGGRSIGAPAQDAPPVFLRIGQLVRVPTSAGSARIGVLLFSQGEDADVCFERGMVKRTRLAVLELHEGEPTGELATIAQQANVFSSLTEGQAVNVERRDGSTQSGVLREKCRYGALVETGEGTVLGVGFGKLWPAPREAVGN